MKRTYEQKPSQLTASVKPTSLNLQTRGFAPPRTDVDQNISSQNRSTKSENLLEKLISAPSPELSDTPIQRKPQNRLKAIQAQRMVIQAKLNIGEPNDKYEKEADQTAAKVVQQINAPSQDLSVQRQESMESEDEELQMKPAISTIQRDASMEEEELQMKSLVQRQENLGGGEASNDLESEIQNARGGGQSLDAGLQAKMGQAMGADFSGVKVHTDSQSDQLNRSIQAKAFTTGQDVFFRQGAYEPSSRGGQELIAHELTHVVQQTGAGQAQSDRPIINKAPAQIQRLISRDDFIYLAGQPSSKAKWDSSTYTKILQCLRDHEKTNDNAKKQAICNDIKRLCLLWIDGHMEQGDNGGTEVQENSDIRKADYIERLLEEVQVELGEKTDTDDDTPSEIMDDLRQEQTDALDAINQQETNNPNAANYKLTLFAAIQNPYLIKFAQKRLDLTIQNEKNRKKNKLRSKKKEKQVLTNTEIKNEAARQVLEEEETQEFQGMTLTEQQAAIQKLANASSAVGHTWVKLSALDANDNAVKEHSFGFYPLGGYNRPELSVPGQVVYPDKVHQNDPSQLALDYDLTQDQYDQALAMAISQLKSPPEYKLIDYNCTLFAKKIVQTAEQNFPSNAFMTIPSGGFSAITGLNQQKAFNPNGLYEALGKNLSAYEPEEVQQAQQQSQQQSQQQAQQQAQRQAQNALENLLSTNAEDKTIFTLQQDLNVESQGRKQVVPAGKNLRIIGVEEDLNEDKLVATIEVSGMYKRFIVDAQELHDAIADQL